MTEPIPVYGQGFFSVSPGLITYVIVFDYYDPDGYYRSLIESGGVRNEERMLARNMQRLMDEERVVMNGEEARTVVTDARIELRGAPDRASITFVSFIKYKPRRGINVYENVYEATTAEYDYTVYWIPGPCVELLEIDTPGRLEFRSGIAVISVKQGTHVPGYESVSFKLKC